MTAAAETAPAVVLEPARARATAKYVHMSPTKVRRVVAMIKGLPLQEALDILRFTPHAAARPLFKVVASAAANAENNLDLDRDTLVVAAAYAGTQGVPALFGRELFPQLLALRGAAGARELLQQYAHLPTVDFPGGATDVDTEAQYAAL